MANNRAVVNVGPMTFGPGNITPNLQKLVGLIAMLSYLSTTKAASFFSWFVKDADNNAYEIFSADNLCSDDGYGPTSRAAFNNAVKEGLCQLTPIEKSRMYYSTTHMFKVLDCTFYIYGHVNNTELTTCLKEFDYKKPFSWTLVIAIAAIAMTFSLLGGCYYLDTPLRNFRNRRNHPNPPDPVAAEPINERTALIEHDTNENEDSDVDDSDEIQLREDIAFGV